MGFCGSVLWDSVLWGSVCWDSVGFCAVGFCVLGFCGMLCSVDYSKYVALGSSSNILLAT
jgi:hypothetical protein